MRPSKLLDDRGAGYLSLNEHTGYNPFEVSELRIYYIPSGPYRGYVGYDRR